MEKRVVSGADSTVLVADGVLTVIFPAPQTSDDDLGMRTQRRILGADYYTAIIDLRGNVGGSLPEFITGLYPLIPECRIGGYDYAGEPFALIREYDGRLVSKRFPLPSEKSKSGVVVFDSPIVQCAKKKVPVTVLIDERSMSSSQVIAEMCRVAGHTVLGYAPEDYLHGTVSIGAFGSPPRKGDYVSIPVYRLAFEHPEPAKIPKSEWMQFDNSKATGVFAPYAHSVIALADLTKYENKFISDQHLHAVMRAELMGSNNHMFTSYAEHRSAVRVYDVIGGLGAPPLPTMFAYFGHKMDDHYQFLTDGERAEIRAVHKPTWIAMYKHIGPLVIDLRGMKQDGRGLITALAPFIETTAFAVSVYEQGAWVERTYYLANRDIDRFQVHRESVSNELADRDVTFLVDKLTGKPRDLHAMMFLHYISSNFRVYGEWLAHPEIAWVPLSSAESKKIVTYPGVRFSQIAPIKAIPPAYRPYLRS